MQYIRAEEAENLRVQAMGDIKVQEGQQTLIQAR